MWPSARQCRRLSAFTEIIDEYEEVTYIIFLNFFCGLDVEIQTLHRQKVFHLGRFSERPIGKYVFISLV